MFQSKVLLITNPEFSYEERYRADSTAEKKAITKSLLPKKLVVPCKCKFKRVKIL